MHPWVESLIGCNRNEVHEVIVPPVVTADDIAQLRDKCCHLTLRETKSTTFMYHNKNEDPPSVYTSRVLTFRLKGTL